MWQRNNEKLSTNDPRPNLTSAEPAASIAQTPPDLATIGKNMVIRGQIESQQDLYLDGEVSGSLSAPNSRLTIGPNGKAGAGATAREIVVMGTVEGDLEASEKVTLRKGGSLVGNIRSAGIIIDDGAYFKGAIDIVRRVAEQLAVNVSPAPVVQT